MMRAISSVLRGEGLASAARRAEDRIREALSQSAMRLRGSRPCRTEVLNVSASSIAPRTGGVAIQLQTRLAEERDLRSVALLHPGGLRGWSPAAFERQMPKGSFEARCRAALRHTGARILHVEGTHTVPVSALLAIAREGVALVVSIHDFSLLRESPHDAESSPLVTQERLQLARALFEAASLCEFPSRFLRATYAERLSLAGEVGEILEPAVPGAKTRAAPAGAEVAFAGSVQPHKGGHLLPEIARALARRGKRLHVFGGGDVALLRALRSEANVVLHGYYRAAELPALLATQKVGVVVLPSVVPETYSLTLTQAWMAGCRVVAFDHGAQAERIRMHGGGVLAPLPSGAAGLTRLLERWEAETTPSREHLRSPREIAERQVALYERV